MTLGLEVAVQWIGSRTYRDAQEQLASLDKALDDFYHVYGRLPCPALRNLAPTNTNYGREDCTAAVLSGTTIGGGVLAGALPFRMLGLPLSASLDPYGSKIDYFVTKDLTGTANFANAAAGIEVRTGILQTTCGGANLCEILADPATGTGAAYAVVSHGPDQRGAVTKRGAALLANVCANVGDTRIDAQNCTGFSGNKLSAYNIDLNVLYDSRYNSGKDMTKFYDDITIWHRKDQL